MSGRTASPAVYRRRRAVVLLGLVLLLTLVLAFAWPGFARSDPTVAGPPSPTSPADTPSSGSTGGPTADPAPDVTTPPPSLEPVPRTADTAFAKALPSHVLGFVMTDESGADDWTLTGALEAYTLGYADGAGSGARVVTVTAGQYASDDEARDAAAALVAAGGEHRGEGAVLVDGDTAGRYVVTGGTATGSSTVTWYNGTAVLQVTGPVAVVEDVYAAYPL